ncbi:ABC transporter ATP-binding protein [Crateriforma spongiae]|uniref:ABC transporter ATP-binding protein n=1 Tax=Crateriforma spongiae TaxID=2724528 RepID=UPI001446FC0F|nr:ABC transporter ATP-binding protein [Crateriforma spongiae]
MNAPSPASAIRFQSVIKRYRKTTAVDQVSFDVPSGVVFALLGDNGAGKTTSIKAMLGTVRIDGGSIRVLGCDPVADSVALRHRIGIVPEQPSLYDWMTVDETGWFAAGFHAEGFLARYRESIRRFGIAPGKKIRELSKGMKAKVALSLATAHEPELLILDEPTSGLDPMVRREFLESMIERAATGQTVFLSSHQINEVERVADHVALMKQGRLVHCESLESLKRNTRELLVNVTDTGVPSPLGGDNVISANRTGRQWRLLVRDVTDSQIAEIENSEFVDRCSVNEPSLEEIFVGYIGESMSTDDGMAQPRPQSDDQPLAPEVSS